MAAIHITPYSAHDGLKMAATYNVMVYSYPGNAGHNLLEIAEHQLKAELSLDNLSDTPQLTGVTRQGFWLIFTFTLDN